MKKNNNTYNVLLSVAMASGYSREVVTHEYNMLKSNDEHSPQADQRLKNMARKIMNGRYVKTPKGKYALA